MKIINKKANFQYQLFESFIAGIQLFGTEIKSIRANKVSINESYCVFIDNELYVTGMNIELYSHGSDSNHDPKRNKKLLLNKKELQKIQGKLNEKGFTLIPVTLFINKKGLAKIEIKLAKGKKIFDKREDIKRKDIEREIQRKIK